VLALLRSRATWRAAAVLLAAVGGAAAVAPSAAAVTIELTLDVDDGESSPGQVIYTVGIQAHDGGAHFPTSINGYTLGFAYDPDENSWRTVQRGLPSYWPPGWKRGAVNAFYHPGLDVHFFHTASDSGGNGRIFVYRFDPGE